MIKGRELLGMAVYGPDRQKILGRVCDIAAAADGSISGVVVECGGFFSRRRFLKREQMLNISKSGIITNGQRWTNTIPQQELIGQNKVLGSRLRQEHGRISDILVEDGRIIGVETSMGLLHDLRQGRGFIGWDELQQRG